MCSIGGIKSFGKPIDHKIAKDITTGLLLFGQLRGEHSSGIYTNGRVYKRAIAGETLVETTKFNKMFDAPSSLILTHNRFPTSGGVGDAQAQPFQKNGVVTIHNGWYSNLAFLKHTWGAKKASGVDSELITSVVESYGPTFLPDFLDDTWGSSAIATYVRGKLYLIRDTNPMAYTTKDNLFIFASTAEILAAACQYAFEKVGKIKQLPPRSLYEVTPKGLKKHGTMRTQPWYSTWEDDYKDTPTILPKDEWTMVKKGGAYYYTKVKKEIK